MPPKSGMSGRIVRVIADQALHHLLARPRAQRQADVAALFEAQRTRARRRWRVPGALVLVVAVQASRSGS